MESPASHKLGKDQFLGERKTEFGFRVKRLKRKKGKEMEIGNQGGGEIMGNPKVEETFIKGSNHSSRD